MISPTRFLSGILLLTAFVPPLAASANLTRISFAQESWYDPAGNLYAPHSLVGRVQLTYIPDLTQTNFLNMQLTSPARARLSGLSAIYHFFPAPRPFRSVSTSISVNSESTAARPSPSCTS